MARATSGWTRVLVWQQVDSFSEPERAALAWTDALTQLREKDNYAPLRSRLRDYFSDREIGALTALIVMINGWNRLHRSGH